MVSKCTTNPNKGDANSVINRIIIILFIVVILMFSSFVYNKINDRTESIVSHIDGKQYKVRAEGDTGEKTQAANYLANISKKIDILVDYMLENNLPDKLIATRLSQRWKTCNFRETAANEKSAAYTINKGDEMRLCIRNGEYIENHNTSMFVVLHELGHMMSVTYGHNDEFKENFSYIVHLASALGIYKPENFENKPVDYCGTVINTTPCMGGTCQYTSISAPPLIGVEAFGNMRGFHFTS